MNNQNSIYKKYFKDLYIFLNQYKNNFFYNFPTLFKKDLREDKISIIKIKFNFFKSIFRKSYLIEDLKIIKKAKICFISHYVGNKIINKDKDFYYGNLFEKLKKKDEFFVILINHTNESLSEIKKKFQYSKITRVYINNDFSLIFDFYDILVILKEFISYNIKKIVNPKKFRILRKHNLRLNLNFFLSSRFTLQISRNIIQILNKTEKLNNLISTFEGHTFERIIFNYCKKKNIKSFGYFFSVLREYRNSIYYNFDQKYQPDEVLTSGLISKKDLEYNSPFKQIKILGSNKNITKSKKFNIYKNKKKITILVCPEGLFSETNHMLKIINQEILNKKQFKFIFRTHPLINLKDIHIEKINKNIFFSKNKDVEKDFIASDFIFYNGSSVSIQAVMNGLVPINLNDKNNKFSLDPLYKINKFIVSGPKSLEKIILLINKNKSKIKMKHEIKTIQDYSRLYFQKLNIKTLVNSFAK